MTDADISDKLTPEQHAAIRFAEKMGSRVAKDYPQIAEEYKSGTTREEIIKNYNFREIYRLQRTTISTIRHMVSCALLELMTKEEYQTLGKKNMVEGFKVGREKGGQTTYEQGIGIFAQTLEERLEASIKGGKITGKKNYEDGLGIFALTPKEMIEISRKGGRATYEQGIGVFSQTQKELEEAGKKSAIARDQVPWSNKEKEYIIELCNNPNYQHGPGRWQDYPNYKLIQIELEQRSGTKRTIRTIKTMRRSLRKNQKIGNK